MTLISFADSNEDILHINVEQIEYLMAETKSEWRVLLGGKVIYISAEIGEAILTIMKAEAVGNYTNLVPIPKGD